MIRCIKFFIICAVIAGLFSCSEEFSARLDPLSNALGTASQITVVAEESLWSTAVGDTFDYYFAAAYPILPQPEPLFDIRHFTPTELIADPLRKELRTYVILADLSDVESTGTQMVLKDLGEAKVKKAKADNDYNMAVGYDRWATGQLVIYLFGNTEEILIDKVKKRFPSIAKRVNDFDQKKLQSTVYQPGSHGELNKLIKENFDLDINIPNDYFLAIHENKTIWLRKETDFLSSNILISEIPYHNSDQLTQEGIKVLRDSLGKKYVSSTAENSYMRVNDVDLPMIIQQKQLEGLYAIESRGIWDIENDFMGGPFMSYTILSPDNKKIYTVDGFVHAPGKKKRKFMQHLEVILKTIKFNFPQ